MKFFKTSVVALSMLAGSITAFAQTAEEIVKKHLDAVGGEANWKKLNSVKMVGSMSLQGMEMPITLTTIHDKAMRMDMEIMGTTNYQIITKNEGWTYFPIQQQQKPEPMTPEQVKALQFQLDIQDELVDYKAKGKKIEFIGKDEMEGTEVLKMKLTDTDGEEKTLFFDAGNYYLIKQSQKVEADGKEEEVATVFSNFQKLPEGIVFPMSIESPAGPITFKSIEVNPKIEESIFKPAE